MLQDVVAVRPLGGMRLRIRFEDGVEGEVDLAKRMKFPGMLARLRDPDFFAKVFVHPEFGTVSWPGEIDLDTLVLYSYVTGRSIRSLLNPPQPRAVARRRGRTSRGRATNSRG
jgi:hypothetical protein